jgi:hypothetical protein
MKGFIALLGAAGLVTLSAPASASADSWAVQPTPGGATAQSSVSCWSSGGCLSVGSGQAMVWDGRAWSVVPKPADADMSAVACVSAAFCLVVGTAADALAAWSWNGRRWASLPAPVDVVDGSFEAVTCTSPSSCEAVGGAFSSTVTPLAEKWDGRRWAARSVSGPRFSSYLDGVACESDGRCEAVGNYYPYTCGQGVCVLPPIAWAAGLSGSAWVEQDSMASVSPVASAAVSVACWSSGCTAVGRSQPDTPPDYLASTFAARWNGRTWSAQGGAGGGERPGSDNAYWSAVHCASALSCTAVGQSTVDFGKPDSVTSALISTWNGKTWKQASAPAVAGYLRGISCARSGTACEAVGVLASNAALAMSNHGRPSWRAGAHLQR